MGIEDFLRDEIEIHQDVILKTHRQVAPDFKRLVEVCQESISSGGKIMFFGNGGSAADAQHLATEMVVRYKLNRKALAAIAFTTDTSLLTAMANDIGFEAIFSRQIEALGRPGDVAIGISTSGQSPNVLKALELAQKNGITSVGFTGDDGGGMSSVTDILVRVPSNTTARIQEIHILLGHVLCDLLEQSAAKD
ncbi:MAG: phosphoheptose isomerase [Rhodospirillaceae bacterium]|nr:MAG: phosphoheptose isomerase [Rhodospirillaceae bacterium]